MLKTSLKALKRKKKLHLKFEYPSFKSWATPVYVDCIRTRARFLSVSADCQVTGILDVLF